MNVKSFLQLPITKKFSIVAGRNGINKIVKSVEILDFEFSPDIQTVRETTFNANSVVLSSLLFAKQKPEYLIVTIKNLINLGVSALAYKPVIYGDLPEEVLSFADAHSFPILRFGGDEFFEDIILEAVAYSKREDNHDLLQSIIHNLIVKEMSNDEIQSYLLQLNKPLEKYGFVANIQPGPKIDPQWQQSFFQLESLLRTGIICTYKESIMLILTNSSDRFQFEKILNEWMAIYDIPKDTLIIGYSKIHITKEELHLAVREAFFSRVMASIYTQPISHYEELGSDCLLIELYRKDTLFAIRFAEKYIGPLLDEKIDSDYMNTAISCVIKKGNIKEVADAHFCHPNTIRYRMTRIRQLIAPLENDFSFYEQLSAAIKIYLLHKKIDNL